MCGVPVPFISNPGHGKTTIKNNKIKSVVLKTDPHLKTGVDSTPETLCEKHFRQWIPSNKFMLQIKHHCHKPFELQETIVLSMFTGSLFAQN